MSGLASTRLSLGALLLAKLCYGQDPVPPSESVSATTSAEEAIFSILNLTSDALPPNPPFDYPPGNYTIDNTVFTVACETSDTPNGLSPYTITKIANSIDDYGACMALCSQLEDQCSIALWDRRQANHCILLSPVSNGVAAPGSRCYAAKNPNESPGSHPTYPVSSSYPTTTPSSEYSNSSEYSVSSEYPVPSESPESSDYPKPSSSDYPPPPEYSLTSRPYPPGPRPSRSRRPSPPPYSSPEYHSSSTSESCDSSSSTTTTYGYTTSTSDEYTPSPTTDEYYSTTEEYYSTTEEYHSTSDEHSSTTTEEYYSTTTTTTAATPSDEHDSTTPTTTTTSSDAYAPTRADAYCGTGHGPIPFESCPQADAVFGRCCSQFGYCGNSTLYCGWGCQSDFGSCGGEYDSARLTDYPSISTVYLPRRG